ncbi:WS/DGAT/MGAT family O-acyltransferase [Nocardioides sp. Iso805N]|uniref:WS/DGAT/MGAT family O-acyltransferase n=1 Tax=Nocardioides sp. Iso805N TaxID=1283287 RepID=UPI0003607D24|nr:wax ester/triacylglycerol synthase family O-acyltransferase [Nocardioides sp. Iso805N]
MGDRLSARDLAFLTRETLTTQHHLASIEILEPGESGFDYDTLLNLVADRLSFVPRYRQRVQLIPGRLANPVWVDDERFDIEYHVRRSAVPRPGSLDQLRDLVGRIISRPLDRGRPLWEIYYVEGLAEGRVALLTKVHQALVDGVHTVDLNQLLLDVGRDPKPLAEDAWNPRRESNAALVIGAVRDSLTDVDTLSSTARRTGGSLLRVAADTAGRALDVVEAITGRRQDRATPLSGSLSQQRLIVTLETSLGDFRKVRDTHGGTVNDVILAVVTGGLRGWLMTRAESLSGLRQVRALVPISVNDDLLENTSLGAPVTAHYVDLPVGEPSAVVRLHQVSYSFETHKQTGRAIPAEHLTGITGFAPTTFHAVGARVAAEADPHGFQVSVTNVPGPQTPRYAAGATLLASYPVNPLLPGQALAIGVTSYDGRVFFGITADRDLVPDADVFGQCLLEALDELLDTVNGGRHQVPRGRRKKSDS